MKALLSKLWAWLTQKSRLLFVIIILLLLGLGLTVFIQHNTIVKLKDQNQTEVNLASALLDSTKYYQNKRGEWVAEKLTLQTSLSNLQKINNDLTVTEKDLLARITDLNKKNTIIAAALIESSVTIDSLKNSKAVIDTTNKSIAFGDSTKNLKYRIRIDNVLPLLKFKPILTFQYLTLPNTQFIEFHWKNDKKLGYPVAFSVTNTNEYFKTINIDSYVIPEIKESTLKPTFWQNVGTFFKSTGGKFVWFGIGGAAGIVAGHYLLK